MDIKEILTKPATQVVDLPGRGPVTLTEIAGERNARFLKLIDASKDNPEDAAAWQAGLIALSVLSEDGSPALTDEDAIGLPLAVRTALYVAACELNTIGAKAGGDAEKN